MTTDAHQSAAEGIGPPLELPSFSGPLDLLLHLIRANDVSIYDIPIALICDQFHDYLAAMQELDLEEAGEYLWMASWLLQLKSKMLLPRREEGEEDPREELVERLLEYRRVKELAALLHDEDVVRRCLWTTELAPELDPGETELDWEHVDLRILAQTYLEVMQRHAAANPPPLQILPLRYRVQDKMREIVSLIHDDGSMALLRNLHSRADIEEVVVMFVAALELVRLGVACAEQRQAFAEIYLRRGRVELQERHLRTLTESPSEADGGS
jgi:segregation and condensation protein A